MVEAFDVDMLDESNPFEVDAQAAHLFKHHNLGIADVLEVWVSDPLFYPAKPPAHWLMVGEVDGRVLVVPLAPPRRVILDNAGRLGVTRRLRVSQRRIERIVMSTESMSPDQEYQFYADPANQQPQGPPRRRAARLSAPVPVRFPPQLLEEIKRAAEADDRSVSAWIRRAVEHELHRSA